MEKALAKIIRSHMAKHDVPGVAIATIKDAEIVGEIGVGFANIATGAPPTPRTAWPICSLTKSMTCAAVMQLSEQGLIDIGQPARTYLPEWRVKDPDASEQITVKRLMHHASGLGRVGFQDRVRREQPNPFPNRQSLMDAIATADLQSPPGRFWAYSNEGFSTLGRIIETVSGIGLEEYFQTRIFEPMGMDDTLVRFTDWRAASDRVFNYIREGSDEKPSGEIHDGNLVGFLPDDYQTYFSTGGVVSTAHDLALYQIASMNYVDGPLLNADSLTAMQSVAFEYGDTGWGYGFGWSVFRSGDLKVVGHAGGMVGLSTYSLFIPDEQVGVVVLTNRSEASSFTLAEQLLGVMRGAPIWRDSVGQPLPFESRFRWSENLSLTCYDGDYVHAGVTSRIRAVGDDLRFKLIRNGVEISEDVATHVGDETFLSRGTATIMQFIRDEHGKGKILLEGGLIFHRQDDSVD